MAIIEDEIRDESGNFPDVRDLCTCETSQMEEGAWSNSRDARLIRFTWEAACFISEDNPTSKIIENVCFQKISTISDFYLPRLECIFFWLLLSWLASTSGMLNMRATLSVQPVPSSHLCMLPYY